MLVGPDVSDSQGSIDWPALTYSGGELAFAIAKASEGHTFTEPTFARNWSGIRQRGLVRGAYHFARPHVDGVASTAAIQAAATAEAEHMLSVLAGVGGLQPGDLPPALDLETSVGLSSAQIYEWAATWVQVVAGHVGRKPLIYTGIFWKENLTAYTDAWGCPLWLAQYGPAPQLPRAWSSWTFWQFTDAGRLGGIAGATDMSYFHGSEAELHSLCLGSVQPDNRRHGTRPPRPAGQIPRWPGRPLRRGAHGEDVRTWQQQMRARGFVHMKVDGAFGPQSVEYCRWLQQYLQRPPNGEVDQALWTSTWQAP